MEQFDPILDDLMDVVGGDKAVTYVCFVQDHSGSMGEFLAGSEQTRAQIQMENYNEQMVVLRRATGEMETLVTLVEFDDNIKTRYKNVPVAEAIDLGDYWTGGMTALYDAVGMSIRDIESVMEDDPRPNKAALIIVQTDGFENRSKEFSKIMLKNKIADLEKTGIWTFVFLGENLDSDIMMDVSMQNQYQFSNTAGDYKRSSTRLSDGISNYYTGRARGATKSDTMMSDPSLNPADEFMQMLKNEVAKRKEDVV